MPLMDAVVVQEKTTQPTLSTAPSISQTDSLPHTTIHDVNQDGTQSHHSRSSYEETKLQKATKAFLNYWKEQWFLIGLGVVITIASQRQVSAENQELKETIVLYTCVGITFLVTGCTLPTRTLIANCFRWKPHLFVQIQCFLMTSATTFGIVTAAATNRRFMDPALLVGMIITGIVPTTISSNVVLTRQAHGNTAMTVVQSTLGNLLGPFLVPLLLELYTRDRPWYTNVLPNNNGATGEVYRRVFKQLGLSLFLPLFVGQIIQNAFPEQTDIVLKKWRLAKINSFCLLAIIWSTYDQAFQAGAFSSVQSSNMIFVVFISIALWLLWVTVAFATACLWMSREDVVAACYCIPAKTPAMGIPLVQTIYVGLNRLEQSKLQIPMVIYQGLQIAGSSLLVSTFRKWIDRGREKELEAQLKKNAHQNGADG